MTCLRTMCKERLKIMRAKHCHFDDCHERNYNFAIEKFLARPLALLGRPHNTLQHLVFPHNQLYSSSHPDKPSRHINRNESQLVSHIRKVFLLGNFSARWFVCTSSQICHRQNVVCGISCCYIRSYQRCLWENSDLPHSYFNMCLCFAAFAHHHINIYTYKVNAKHDSRNTPPTAGGLGGQGCV